MKLIIVLTLTLILIPCLALAAPFLRCDQYTGSMGDPDYFKISIDGGAYNQTPTFIFPSETGDSIHYDLTAIAVGQHTIKIKACKAATVWEPEVCTADSTPFVFTRPAPGGSLTVPVNISIVSQ